MKELKQIQIDKLVWEHLKNHCSQNGYSLKGFIQKLILDKIKDDRNIQNNKP